MANILIQTTVDPDDENEWRAGRFSSLADTLREDGHSVVARDREPGAGGNDPVLSTLDRSDFDELWLVAADRGNGLAPGDVRGILRFRERGGGVFTARDGENVGTSLLNLGTVGLVNHFRNYNRPSRRTDVSASPPGSAAYRRIIALEPVHELLRTGRSPSGVIEYFPARPHGGTIAVPPGTTFARVIAVSSENGGDASNNVAIAIDNELRNDGRPCGRAVATSSLQLFADGAWNGGERGEIFKDFVRNAARWLAPENA